MILNKEKSQDLVALTFHDIPLELKCIIQVFAVGVGSGVQKSELNEIATDPDSTHVLTVKDFSQLTQITAQLNNKACAGTFGDNLNDPIYAKSTLL